VASGPYLDLVQPFPDQSVPEVRAQSHGPKSGHGMPPIA
jgi:hypothetical protein